MHHVAVALDDHLFFDVDTAGLGDAAEIVARQIDQHDVLGALLRIGQQFRGVPRIFLRGLAAPAGAGNRADFCEIVGDANVHFGRAAHEGERSRRKQENM